MVHLGWPGKYFKNSVQLAVFLCFEDDDDLRQYRENFEKKYVKTMEDFYRQRASKYLEENGAHIRSWIASG